MTNPLGGAAPPRKMSRKKFVNSRKKPLDKRRNLCYHVSMMNMKAGTQVQHRDNPNWRAVVVRDLNPRKPVNGLLVVNHNGREHTMPKTTLKVSFHLDAKKEFGEFVS